MLFIKANYTPAPYPLALVNKKNDMLNIKIFGQNGQHKAKYAPKMRSIHVIQCTYLFFFLVYRNNKQPSSPPPKPVKKKKEKKKPKSPKSNRQSQNSTTVVVEPESPCAGKFLDHSYLIC